MFEIRPATERDVPALVALAEGLVREDAGQRDPFANLSWPRNEGVARFGKVVSDDDAACFLALVHGEPIGFISGRLEFPSSFRLVTGAVIGSLFVLSSHRGQRAGEHLADAFLTWAHTKGAEIITVSAFASNNGALRFYERVGFAPHTVTLQYTIDQS